MYAATRAAGSVLRQDAFDMGEPAANGWGATGAGDGLLSLDEALAELRDAGKGVTIDVKEAGILDEVFAVVARSGVRDEDLWLNGRMDVLGEDGVRAIRATHPGATVQCPIDFIAPLAIAMPNEALGLLRTLTGWGVAARMTNVRGANTEGCHKRPSGISMLLAWIEMWPPPCISTFSFSCPTSTRLIGWLGAPQRAQTTDSRRSRDALIATYAFSRANEDGQDPSFLVDDQSKNRRAMQVHRRRLASPARSKRRSSAPRTGPNRTNPLASSVIKARDVRRARPAAPLR